MKTQRVAVKALIVKNKKALLLKRSSKEEVFSNLWDIPGGRLTPGESPMEGLVRESKEEINVGVKAEKPWKVWDFMADKNTQVVGITFICSLKKGKIKLSGEHTEYLWANIKEVKKLPMDKYLRKEIISYIES